MKVYNSEISDIFNKVADLLEINGSNQFRIRAYREAAGLVTNQSRQIQDMIENDEDLTKLPGIGDDLAAKMKEIVETGELKQLKELEKKLPIELTQLLDIEGLGPKRVAKLYQQLDIQSMSDLEQSLDKGEIKDLEGFGEKTQENIKQALKEYQERGQARTYLKIAEEQVQPLIQYLKEIPQVKEVEAAGSYRRKKETIGDIDILATSSDKELVIEKFTKYDQIDKIVSQGETKSTVKLRTGMQVDLRVVNPNSYGSALLYFTGSKHHNIELRNLAIKNNWKVNEYGVFDKKDKQIAGQTEEDVYDLFDAQYIPPELREARGEIDAARQNKLPKLITLDDLKGDLQMHTTDSDGRYSLEKMVEAAKEMGHQYIAITDHSAYMGITQGLDEKGVEEQIKKIKKLNEKMDSFQILSGIEVDVMEDGALDLADETLSKLDIVLCSVHTKFNLPRKEQTARVIKAISHPAVNILSHPTTRVINEREPIDIDLEKIFQIAKEKQVAIEINAHPSRLDINDRQAKEAKNRGVKIAISTDAHRAEELHNLQYGIYQARRGWLEPADVINTWGLEDLLKFLNK
jgi:DNA polymerase (family 10)